MLVNKAETIELALKKRLPSIGVSYVIEGTSNFVNPNWSTESLTTLIDDEEQLIVSYHKASGLPFFMRIRVEDKTNGSQQ